jgi:hypothetical protein
MGKPKSFLISEKLKGKNNTKTSATFASRCWRSERIAADCCVCGEGAGPVHVDQHDRMYCGTHCPHCRPVAQVITLPSSVEVPRG